MRLLGLALGSLPSRLSCFGAGEDAVNKPYTQGNNPPFSYANQPDTTFDYNAYMEQEMAAQQAQQAPIVVNTGEEIEYQQAKEAGSQLTPDQQKIYGTMSQAPVSSSGAPQVAVQPSTSSQIFNLINTVAKGMLDVQKTQAQTKLSTAQAAALSQASKVQAQNYVMQQLQQGKQVMVPESWLQKYASSGTLTKWLTPILIIGGVGLLGYAVYLYTKKKATASNPRRRR